MSARMDKLREWVSHPLNLVLGLLASFASILSVFLYFHSIEVRELTFLVHPFRTTVVKSGQASRLKASFDGKEITNDVTAAQITFWNAGKRAIRRGEILEPITVATGADHPVLEATLRKSTRQVTHISLTGSQLDKGEISISWDILENLDGGVLQLIYAGDAGVPISLRGTVEGQGSIRLRAPSPGSTMSPEERNAERVKATRFQMWLGIVMLAFTLALFVMTVREKPGPGRRISLWLSCFIVALVLYLALFHFWQYKQASVPFGLWLGVFKTTGQSQPLTQN